MASVTQLGYLGLSIGDVNEWERFATQVLGLQVSGHDDDGAVFLRMDEYHHRFILHPNGHDDVAYIGWEVADEEGLHGMAKQLEAAGVAVRQGTEAEAQARRVVGLIRFGDPNHIPSEVFYGPQMSFDDPFKSPRPIAGFETGIQGLGRHTNDHMLSFYLRTPSGFEVEYGWGGRVVDDTTWQVQHHTKGSIWGHRSLAVPQDQEAVAARR